jgi:hypothetical protein
MKVSDFSNEGQGNDKSKEILKDNENPNQIFFNKNTHQIND